MNKLHTNFTFLFISVSLYQGRALKEGDISVPVRKGIIFPTLGQPINHIKEKISRQRMQWM